MFSPLDILYIVLAFCALWLTAAIFWLIWQVATVFRNVNTTLSEARSVMGKIEVALNGMKQKFEQTTSVFGVVVASLTKLVEHTIETRLAKKTSPRKGKTKTK